MKLENRSHKRSHELDGIGVGKIRTVPFSSDSAYDSYAYDPVKTRLSESQAEGQESTNYNAGFILRLPLTTPTIYFSLDHKHKSHKRNRRKWIRSDFAYDSDFRFSLGREALTTPTPTTSPAKTNL